MSLLNFKAGNRVVLRLATRIDFKKGEVVNSSPLQGEVELKVEEASTTGATLSLVRLGLYGVGYSEAGQVSLRGLEGTGILAGHTIDLSFRAGLTYNALELQQYEQYVSSTNPATDHFSAHREIFSGQLQVRFSEFQEPKRLTFGFKRLYLRAEKQFLGLIDEVESQSLESPGVGHLYDLGAELACLPKLQALRRRLRIRAVFFKADDRDLGTGANWPTQRDAATCIWRKCGIDLVEVLPPVIINNSILKSGADRFGVIFSHFDDPGIILIFFVSGGPLGGGWTFGDGAAHARCIISDQAVGNFNVMAHEFGHVFDGDHPGHFGPATTWAGDRCTVLMPNGSLSLPNSSQNTLHNCLRANNDALETTGMTCLTPDQDC